jgi:putative spermidine/putrescine transport system substrate-binding protein
MTATRGERYGHKKRTVVDRRRLLQTGVARFAAAAGPLLATGARAQARTVFVNTWGGSWTAAEEAAFFKPFTEATGVRVQTVAPVSYASSGAVQSGRYEWDVTEINQSEWLRGPRPDRADRLDRRAEGQVVSMPSSPAASLLRARHQLCYRKDKFPNGGPQSWVGFWDVRKFPERARSTTVRRDRWPSRCWWTAYRRKALSDGYRPRLQEARPDQTAYQSVVDAGNSRS